MCRNYFGHWPSITIRSLAIDHYSVKFDKLAFSTYLHLKFHNLRTIEYGTLTLETRSLNSTMLKLKHLKSNKVVAAIAVVSMYLLAVNMNIYKRSMLSDQHRALAKHLGGGDCSIGPLAEIAEAPESAVKTLLTSYPGSGKRFTFQVIKGLTNHDVADDWDFSGLLKHNPLTVKTSWPHKEGIWSWENDMDQVILLIRNPRWAIPSYHTMRYELNFSQDWLSTFTNMEFVYTKRPNIKVWNEWRDANFETEIVRWFGFIDFWMQGK